MATRRHQRCRGASLLEVLTATGIMALVLGVGVPQMTRIRGPYALVGAARQIAADLQVARQRAVARNARYRVSFDTASARYTLQRETSTNVFTNDGGPQKLPKGVTLGSPSPGNPIFDTRGMMTADLAVQVSVAGTGSKVVNVNVLGQTTIQ